MLEAWPIIQVLLGAIGTLASALAAITWWRLGKVSRFAEELEKRLIKNEATFPICESTHGKLMATNRELFTQELHKIEMSLATIQGTLALMDQQRCSDAEIMKATLENLRMTVQLIMAQAGIRPTEKALNA